MGGGYFLELKYENIAIYLHTSIVLKGGILLLLLS